MRRSCAGQGAGDIIKKEWKCRGSESNLTECDTTPDPPSRVCDNRTEAGVYCSGVYIDMYLNLSSHNNYYITK